MTGCSGSSVNTELLTLLVRSTSGSQHRHCTLPTKHYFIETDFFVETVIGQIHEGPCVAMGGYGSGVISPYFQVFLNTYYCMSIPDVKLVKVEFKLTPSESYLKHKYNRLNNYSMYQIE